MNDSTAQHDYTPPPPATFQEPVEATWARVQAGLREVNTAAAKVEALVQEPIGQCRGGEYCDTVCPGLGGPGHCGMPAAPTDEVPADPAPPAGPTPLLEGTFAIFVTPEESIVVAYRPRGAGADKHFVVPAFIVGMASQHSGHSASEILKALKEGL